MNIQYIPKLDDQSIIADLWQLVKAADYDFIPPLSARESTSQVNLLQTTEQKVEPVQYFEELKRQQFLVALEDGHVIGFMSFVPNYIAENLQESEETIYISTIIVDQSKRGLGITTSFYAELNKLAQLWGKSLTTRTWSTNDSHISILHKLGFTEILRLKDARAAGIDTVYYRNLQLGAK